MFIHNAALDFPSFIVPGQRTIQQIAIHNCNVINLAKIVRATAAVVAIAAVAMAAVASAATGRGFGGDVKL